MSKTIDEKVVEMRFDNSNFESNVKTSMSTLDKLKQKLNFSGASKGLEGIDQSVKKINFSGLTKSIDLTKAGFLALGAMGVLQLRNIANAADQAGTSMIKSLTLEPIKTGFNEYETQINAIQTIMSNTRSKGTTLDDVNAALDELNHYADQTIYNFTEMTRNIGTFTAAGVDLDKAVTSIKGIANLGAISGSTSVQVSTAMYQLSQALAAGRVSLMDWNSVVNAGMGGEVFQEALKRTAEHMGTDVDAIIEKYGSFRESLTQGQWLTADVLTETLTQLSGAYTEADLIAQGYTEDQAKEITALAKDAVSAATDVKTFSQLWETTQEAVQSGWTNTWELIVGDFGEAKGFLSNISQQINDMVNQSADARNNLLAGALDSNWDKFTDQLANVGTNATDYIDQVGSVLRDQGVDVDALVEKYDSLENAIREGAVSSDTLKMALDQVVDGAGTLSDIQAGLDFGAGFDGYSEDVAKIQTALNDLGYSVGDVDGQLGEMTQNAIRAFQEANGLEVTGIVDQATLDSMQTLINQANDLSTVVSGIGYGTGFDTGFDESTAKVQQALKDLGYDIGEVDGQFGDLTQSAVNAFQEANGLEITGIVDDATLAKMQELQGGIEDTKESMKGLLDGVTDLGGRELLQNSFQNILDTVKEFSSIVGDAFGAVFEPLTSDKIYGFIQAIEGFTQNVKDFVSNNADKIQSVIEGFLTVFEAIGGILGVIWDLLEPIRDLIGDLAQWLFDGFAGLNDWFTGIENGIQNSQIFADAINGIKTALQTVIDWIKNFGTSIAQYIKFPSFDEVVTGLENFVTLIQNSTPFQSFVTMIQNIKTSIAEFMQEAPELLSTQGAGALGKRFGELILSMFGDVGDFLSSVFSTIGDSLKNAFSTAGSGFFTPLNDFIQGFLENFQVSLGSLPDGLKTVISNVGQFLGDIDWSQLLTTVGVIAAILIVVTSIRKAAKAVEGIAGAVTDFITSFSKVFEGLGNMFTDIGKYFKGKAFNEKTQGIQNLATALLLLSAAMFIISRMSWEDLGKAGVGMLGMVVIIGLMTTIGDESKKSEKHIESIAKIIAAIAALGIIVRLLGGMSLEDIAKGEVALLGLVVIMKLLANVTKVKDAKKIGSTVLQLSIALGALATITWMLGNMDEETILQGELALAALVVIVKFLASSAKSFRKAANIGGTMLAFAVTLGIMATITAILGNMDPSTLGQGLIFMTIFVVLLKLMAGSAKTFGSAAKIGGTLLAMSVSIGILAAIAVALGKVDTAGLAKGVIAVTIIGTVAALMSKLASESSKGSVKLLALSVSVGILAAIVAALSLLNPARLTVAVACLDSMMVFFGLMAALSNNTKVNMGTLVKLLGAVGVLAVIVSLMSTLNTEGVLASSISLAILMTSMASTLEILDGVGKISGNAIGSLYAIEGAVVIIAIILGVMAALDVEPSIETAAAISTLLVAMSVVTLILSKVGAGAGSAIAGALALDAVIVIIGALIAGIGALATYVPQLQDFIDNAAPVLQGLGEAIGGFIGGIVGGFGEAVTDSLPAIGENLSAFMESAQGFIQGCSQVTSATVAGAGYLAASILAITAANIISAIGNFLSFGQSYADMGSKLSEFATSVKPFMDTMSSYEGTTFTGIDALSTAIVKLTAANFLDGITSILGMQDLGTFGGKIAELGGGMKAFADAVNGMENNAGVQVAASVVDSLAQTAQKIPAEGGWLQKIVGVKDLSGFATGVGNLADAAKTFCDKTSGITDTGNSEAVVSVMQKITDVNNAIPATGGMWQDLFGIKDLSGFADKLGPLADAAVTFCNKTSGITDTANAESVVSVMGKITTVNNAIPATGGLWQKIVGTKDLTGFSAGVEALGGAAQSFCTAISGITVPENVDNIFSVMTKITQVNDAIPATGGLWQNIVGTKDLTGFSDGVSALGGALEAFATATDGIVETDASAAANVASSLAGVANNLPETSTLEKFAGISEMSTFASDVASLGVGLQQFALYTDGITSTDASAAANVALSLSNVAANLKDDDIFSWLGGDHDFSLFSAQLPLLAAGLKTFSILTDGISDTDSSAAADVAESLANVYDKLKDDTLFGWISGSENFTDFSSNLASLGSGLSGFATQTNGIDTEAAGNAAAVAQTLADVYTTLNSDGLWDKLVGWLTGDNKLSNFSNQLGELGTGLSTFATNTSGITNTESIKATAEVVKTIAEASSNIDNGVGGNKIRDFGEQLGELGTGINSLYTNISGVDTGLLSSIAPTIKTIAEASSSIDNGVGGNKIRDFGGQLGDLGNGINNLNSNMSGVDATKLSTVATSISDFVTTINSTIDIDTSKLQGYVDAVGKLNEVDLSNLQSQLETIKTAMGSDASGDMSGIASGISGQSSEFGDAGTALGTALQNGFNSSIATFAPQIVTMLNTMEAGISNESGNFSTCGNTLVQALAQGFSDGSSYLASAISTSMGNCVAAVGGYYDSFYSAGENVAQGFADGISDGAYAARIAAQAMANAAAAAARQALDEHSPSKVFARIGSYASMGMAQGIDKMSYMVIDSVDSMSKASIESLRTAMSNINASVGTDINANPIITPVLDLSNVQNGAKTLNTMMSSIGASNLSASINTSRNFTGNSDVVSALDSLRGDLSNLGRPSYSIGGITYDDGSNIAIAVGDLIRAVRLERRS